MTITPEQLQQAIQAAVAAAAQQRQEAAAQMQQEIGTLRAQVQTPPTMSASLVDTRLLGKPESFDGGAGWKDWSIVFRSHASACSAPLGSLLERTERSADPVLNATLTHGAQLHAGHAVQRDSPRAEGPGCLQSSRLTPRSDLVDAHRGSVARAPERQLRRRDRSTNGPARPRRRPLRESKRREHPEQHPHWSSFTHAARRTIETASRAQQCQTDHVGNAEGRNRQRQMRASCCQLDAAAQGRVSVWCLPEGQRQKQAKGRHPENTTSRLREDRALEERLLVQRGETQAQRKGRGWQGKELCWRTATTVRQGQERCEVLELRCSRTCRKGLSEEETESVGCRESSANIRCDFKVQLAKRC